MRHSEAGKRFTHHERIEAHSESLRVYSEVNALCGAEVRSEALQIAWEKLKTTWEELLAEEERREAPERRQRGR